MTQALRGPAEEEHDPAVEYAEQMLGEMPGTEATDQNLHPPGINTTTSN